MSLKRKGVAKKTGWREVVSPKNFHLLADLATLSFSWLNLGSTVGKM